MYKHQSATVILEKHAHVIQELVLFVLVTVEPETHVLVIRLHLVLAILGTLQLVRVIRTFVPATVLHHVLAILLLVIVNHGRHRMFVNVILDVHVMLKVYLNRSINGKIRNTCN